jgi:hypothetical protein
MSYRLLERGPRRTLLRGDGRVDGRVDDRDAAASTSSATAA